MAQLKAGSEQIKSRKGVPERAAVLGVGGRSWNVMQARAVARKAATEQASAAADQLLSLHAALRTSAQGLWDGAQPPARPPSTQAPIRRWTAMLRHAMAPLAQSPTGAPTPFAPLNPHSHFLLASAAGLRPLSPGSLFAPEP